MMGGPGLLLDDASLWSQVTRKFGSSYHIRKKEETIPDHGVRLLLHRPCAMILIFIDSRQPELKLSHNRRLEYHEI